MDKATKRKRHHRFVRCGLAHLARAMMADNRDKHRSRKTTGKGHDKETAAAAWDHVYDLLEPVCVVIEKLREDIKQAVETKAQPGQFVGFRGDPHTLLDPDYDETDPAKEIVDAYLWLKNQFRLVCSDSPHGTTLDFLKATTKPPTIFTIQLAEQYARASPGSRERNKLADDIQKAIAKMPTKNEPAEDFPEYAGDL